MNKLMNSSVVHPSRVWRFRGVAFATALIVLATPGSALLAQDIPNMILPPELTSETAQNSVRSRNRAIGSALFELQDRFIRLPVSQQNDSEFQLVSGMVTIEAIATDSASALLSDLQELGLENGTTFGRLVSGNFPLSAVSTASLLPTLRFVSLSRAFTRSSGAASNQADEAMQTILARPNFNVDGSGITIGILSDSYNQLGGEAADIASGDLPNNVVVLDDSALGTNIDEGRAMAQLIHDIAPGADLIFHTAFNGRADFADGILELADAGADIIVDDIGYFAAPFFQDGPVAQAVDQVVSDGVSYYSSAGNADVNSYEAPYVDSGLDFNAGIFPVSRIHEFAPGDVIQEFVLVPGQGLLLSVQWDQPFASSGGTGSEIDIDAFLIDSSLNVITESATGNIGFDAVDLISYTNNTGQTQQVGLIVGLFEGVDVPGVLKWINFTGFVPHNHETFSSTVYAHPNAAGAVAVGASQYNETPAFGVDPALIEPFSSHGGLGVLFDTAGNRLMVPDDRNKPDLTAPDGVDTTFFSSGDFDGTGFPNFFGTSAAAPNAAALAALQLECNPTLSPAEIRSQQINTALDMESPGFDNVSGAGLVDGLAAVTAACGVEVLTCNGLPIDVFIGEGDSPTTGDDVILGTAGADTINSLAGNDTICALGGDDNINAGGGDDWIDAGAGDDRVLATAGDDMIFGGTGDDEILAGSGNDIVEGEEGDDTLFGQPGNDILDGGDGVDAINGGGGIDTIFTGPGATVGTGKIVTGNVGNDIINGGPDADELRGFNGLDTINGGGGNDVISGGDGRDTIDGGAGNDDIRGQNGIDLLSGGSGNDFVNGGSDNDTINGGPGTDELIGGPGDDIINGDGGNDDIEGGSGNDDMSGGSGSGDSCNGQSGTDTADSSCEIVVGVP